MRSNGCRALIAVLFVGVCVGSAQSQALDQSFTAGSDLGTSQPGFFALVGQTYTAGLTGVLTGVRLDLTETDTVPLRVTIEGVAGGLPNGVILGSTIFPSTSATLADLIPLPGAISQVAGQQYAIVTDFPAAIPAFGIWHGATRNLYPSGDEVLGDGTTWSFGSLGDFDLHFQTFVIPAGVPEPGIGGLLIGALTIALACAGRRRRMSGVPRA